MKTTIKIIATFVLLALFKVGVAQAPNGINYQATIRDASGILMTNQSVAFIFELRLSSASGTVVYSETQTLTTNNYGGVAAIIGQGSATIGTFSSIDWNNQYYLNVNADGSDLGTSQFQSVPYALFSNEASYAHDASDAEFADVAAELANPIWKTKQSNGDVFTTDVPIIIGDSLSDADGLTISMNKVNNNSELVDLIVDTLTLNKDVLNIAVGEASDDNGQYIECSKNGVTKFKVNVDGYIQTKSSIKINGEIRTFSTGTANMIPIAYGKVDAAGVLELNTSTPNVTVLKLSPGEYKITITGVTPNPTDFVTIGTSVASISPGFVYSNTNFTGIYFYTDDITGAHVDHAFNFVIYNP